MSEFKFWRENGRVASIGRMQGQTLKFSRIRRLNRAAENARVNSTLMLQKKPKNNLHLNVKRQEGKGHKDLQGEY